MKYSKYFGTKRRGFIKSESILVPKGEVISRMKISSVIVVSRERSLTFSLTNISNICG
jgi:hypothetical protein